MAGACQIDFPSKAATGAALFLAYCVLSSGCCKMTESILTKLDEFYDNYWRTYQPVSVQDTVAFHDRESYNEEGLLHGGEVLDVFKLPYTKTNI